jgi:phage/plasmid-like protein (TIGR03299 family)
MTISHPLMESGANTKRMGRRNPYAAVGTAIPEGVTDAVEALKLGGLDFTVHLDPMTTTHLGETGVTTLDVPRKFAVNAVENSNGAVRVLDVVGNVYYPRQNLDTAVALQHIVDSMDGKFIAAGHTNNGAKTFVQMELPDNATRIGGIDNVAYSLVALNSHDGHGKFKIVTTATRIACMNQLPGIRKAEHVVGFSHTKGSGEQVDMVALRKALNLAVKDIEGFTTLGNELISRPMTVAEFDLFAKQVIPAKRDEKGELVKYVITARETLGDLFRHSDTMGDLGLTQWRAYNAVTEFDQWVKGRANAERTVSGRADNFARNALALLV